MFRIHHFCFLVLFVFLLGCNGGNVPLRGTVTFSDDGSPLTQGTVAFLKDGQISRGDIQSDGTFTVGTVGATDGLAPGIYQVYITGSERIVPVGEDGTNTYEPLIDRRHERPETSGLTVEVDASTRTLDIQVDRFTGTGGRR
jgi:hypothetical protein